MWWPFAGAPTLRLGRFKDRCSDVHGQMMVNTSCPVREETWNCSCSGSQGSGPGPGPALMWIWCVSLQVGSGGEAEEGRAVAAGHLRLHPLHHQTVSIHPGQTRLPQLRWVNEDPDQTETFVPCKPHDPLCMKLITLKQTQSSIRKLHLIKPEAVFYMKPIDPLINQLSKQPLIHFLINNWFFSSSYLFDLLIYLCYGAIGIRLILSYLMS